MGFLLFHSDLKDFLLSLIIFLRSIVFNKGLKMDEEVLTYQIRGCILMFIIH